MARLFVLSGSAIGDSFEIDGTSVIGRSPDADVTVPEASISRRHARLVPQPEPGLWGLVDLDSSNGVFFGGQRVRKTRIRDGETFKLGDVEFRLRDEVEEEAFTDGPGEDHELEFAEDFDELEPAAPAPVRALETVDEDEDQDDDEALELELEFDEDLDAALEAPVPPPSAPPVAKSAVRSANAPGPTADRAGARATADRAARRQSALGRSARAEPSAATAGQDSGRPVLQYAKTRSGGTDLSQVGGIKKLLVVVGALLALGGAAYGAFLLAS